MNLKNCKRCKKVFTYKNIGIKETQEYCPSCFGLISNEIRLLCSCIDSNKEITLYELSMETNISEGIIKKYIITGKIPSVDGYKVTFRNV